MGCATVNKTLVIITLGNTTTKASVIFEILSTIIRIRAIRGLLLLLACVLAGVCTARAAGLVWKLQDLPVAAQMVECRTLCMCALVRHWIGNLVALELARVVHQHIRLIDHIVYTMGTVVDMRMNTGRSRDKLLGKRTGTSRM